MDLGRKALEKVLQLSDEELAVWTTSGGVWLDLSMAMVR